MKKRADRINPWIIPFLIFYLFRFNPVACQSDLPDSVVTKRLHIIEDMLIKGKPNVDRWWYSWTVGYTAATIGQGIGALKTKNEALNEDLTLGAATTFLGAVGQVITPMAARTASKKLARIPENTQEERLQKLIKAEELLKESARNEKSGRSWQMHAITGVVNLASGLIVWHGFKRNVWAGVENFVMNSVVTEAQIWTQPTRAMKDYQNYCRMYKSGDTPVAVRSDINWFVSVTPVGAALRIVF